MKLFKEILIELLKKEDVHIIFPNMSFNITELIEMKSYTALKNIKAILENDNLSDKECFLQIEEIVNLFEQLGSDGGNRHDFG